MLADINNLRVRLILLVVLAALPATGLILYNALEQRRLARMGAQEDAVRLAGLVSTEAQQATAMTHQLLEALAQFPAILNRDAASCTSLLSNLKETRPFCRALAVADPNGEVFCSSERDHKPVNIGDREYFKRALKTHDLAISDFLVGRLSTMPSIAFAHPAFDSNGTVQAVVVASLDLSWLIKGASTARLPVGSVVNIIDSRGQVLARWPDAERWVGRTLPETEIAKQVLEKKEGVAEGFGMEGIPRLYGFQPILPDKKAGYVYVGIPQDVAYGPANRILLVNLIGLAVVIVLGMMMSFFFAHVFILSGVTALVDATKKLASGDLSARTVGTIPRKGEIGQLAMAFDDMAESLQQREEEGKQAAENIRRNAVRSQFLADISEEFISVTSDHEPVFHRVTQRVANWFGDTCFVYLFQLDGGVSSGLLCHSEPEGPSLDHPPFSSPDLDALSLLSQVAQTGNSSLITAADKGKDSEVLLDCFHCRSLLIVPMRADAHVIGALTVIRHRTDAPHTTEDESLLQYIADRAANSVAKARLVQTIQKLNADLEERIKERTAQLTAANKELEAFAYSVSHDLRSPLRAIDGFGRILSEKYAEVLDTRGQDYLHRTRSAAQRMGQLIDDLLSLSRLTRTEMQWNMVDLSTLASEIKAELVQSQAGRAVDWLIMDDLVVRGDERLLRAALENLLGNAWKFTGREVNPRVEFKALKQDGETVFFVRDNGAGFDMQYADQLFGPFQRLHSMSEFPGTGIGLAIVQRVIVRHGGSVWAEGAVGQGATFYFKFPKGV
jgi:signal transduction histidine kinase